MRLGDYHITFSLYVSARLVTRAKDRHYTEVSYVSKHFDGAKKAELTDSFTVFSWIALH